MFHFLRSRESIANELFQYNITKEGKIVIFPSIDDAVNFVKHDRKKGSKTASRE